MGGTVRHGVGHLCTVGTGDGAGDPESSTKDVDKE